MLLGYESFVSFAGTETYTLTVALELIQLGHEVTIYSPQHGAMAEYAATQGVPVVSRGQLPPACELVICSDTATCHELAAQYPSAVRLFVAHSAEISLQAPSRLRDECQAVVVLNDRVRRSVEARGLHGQVVRLTQPIDMLRFRDLYLRHERAHTAMVLSNYLSGPRAELMERACRDAGLRLEWVGSPSRPTPTPELFIAAADLVIGLGRSVLEGMASGRPAYVYGVVGGDGWVTPERYAAMEANGFAGTAFPDQIIDAEALTRDLDDWRASMGEVGRDLVSAHHDAREHAIALVELAHELDAAPPPEPDVYRELAYLVRLEHRTSSRAGLWLSEVERLIAVVAESEALAGTLRTELVEANRAAEAAAAELATLRSTRRYRLASRLAAPLDGVRARLGSDRAPVGGDRAAPL